MVSAPILSNPNFSLPFTIETDASTATTRAVLLQEDHPIAFYSKVLCPRLQKDSAYIRELHAITSSVRKWRHYLLGTSFTFLTDHRILKDLMTQIIQTSEQQTYLSKLLGFDYTIKYKPGTTNVVTDALSRIVPTDATCLALTMPHFTFLNQLRHSLLHDPRYVSLLKDIQAKLENHSDLGLHQDLIVRQGRIWIPFPCSFTEVLLDEFHSSSFGGHTGMTKTIHRL